MSGLSLLNALGGIGKGVMMGARNIDEIDRNRAWLALSALNRENARMQNEALSAAARQKAAEKALDLFEATGNADALNRLELPFTVRQLNADGSVGVAFSDGSSENILRDRFGRAVAGTEHVKRWHEEQDRAENAALNQARIDYYRTAAHANRRRGTEAERAERPLRQPSPNRQTQTLAPSGKPKADLSLPPKSAAQIALPAPAESPPPGSGGLGDLRFLQANDAGRTDSPSHSVNPPSRGIDPPSRFVQFQPAFPAPRGNLGQIGRAVVEYIDGVNPNRRNNVDRSFDTGGTVEKPSGLALLREPLPKAPRREHRRTFGLADLSG